MRGASVSSWQQVAACGRSAAPSRRFPSFRTTTGALAAARRPAVAPRGQAAFLRRAQQGQMVHLRRAEVLTLSEEAERLRFSEDKAERPTVKQ